MSLYLLRMKATQRSAQRSCPDLPIQNPARQTLHHLNLVDIVNALTWLYVVIVDPDIFISVGSRLFVNEAYCVHHLVNASSDPFASVSNGYVLPSALPSNT